MKKITNVEIAAWLMRPDTEISHIVQKPEDGGSCYWLATGGWTDKSKFAAIIRAIRAERMEKL